MQPQTTGGQEVGTTARGSGGAVGGKVDKLRSEFAGDPDMAELVEAFVSEMPQRVEGLRRAWESQALDDLRRLAHQLKGASGGYGYPALGQAAAGVETTLNKMASGGQATMASLRQEFDALVSLCGRVAA